MDTVVKVGIADMNIVTAPNTIRTTGLGSCVGVIVYDSSQPLAGLAHIMLPDSSIAKNSQSINKSKFADTAIIELKSRIIHAGGNPLKLKAKIAGGAEMFSFSAVNEVMRIGPRNVEAVKSALQNENIQLVAEDTGGNSGRTIEFNPETLILQVRTVNKGIMEL
ncbi:chemotaxis protein CheD [Heyndrickxia sporothermodurans]|uniref:chemotaxis protein CheD n=1 Tax=Heyndrickxia sporothermodurans TaxID=46224 RepID=UPI002E1F1E4C|nr:chemotaxis protein CheD [Heyndrickxia sporothermodurans]